MWGISILADFRPMWCISFHAVVVFGVGKNLLFKSVLGLCVPRREFFFRIFSYVMLIGIKVLIV